jgi:hypothetical protein
MCQREDLEAGAYLKDPEHGKLYECHGRHHNVVHLADATDPVDHPDTVRWLITQALKRLELVQAAPTYDETVGTEEWGEAG